MPERKAERRQVLPAELLNQPVVTAAAADGTLCAERACNKFKNGSCVVIEAPYDFRVDGVGDSRAVEIPFYARKVLPAFLANIVEHRRRVLRYFGAHGAFAVENAHGVALQP